MIKIPVQSRETAVKVLMKNHAAHKGVKGKAAAAHAPLRMKGVSAVQGRKMNKRVLNKNTKTPKLHKYD